jgi:hypothetical protein
MSSVNMERRRAVQLIAGDMIDNFFPQLARDDHFYRSKTKRLRRGRERVRILVPYLMQTEENRFGTFDDGQLFDELRKSELQEQIEGFGVYVAKFALGQACEAAFLPRNRTRHLMKEAFLTASDQPTTAVGYVEDTLVPIYAYEFASAARSGVMKDFDQPAITPEVIS